MNSLRTIKKLILGETWLLPAGLAVTLAAAALLRHTDGWPRVGGFMLLAGVIVVLLASVNRSARRPRP